MCSSSFEQHGETCGVRFSSTAGDEGWMPVAIIPGSDIECHNSLPQLFITLHHVYSGKGVVKL